MRERGFYAYIRTSTVKQGTEGVSLDVQRTDAERLARQKNIRIVRFFCEMETAAAEGRPIFTQMMRDLRAGRAEGLILHKIDRGARNLREWSDITDLIELGMKVYFVNDALDLTTRGGRLTGDMLAAVAADYIRNLREETKKGIAGRLKQGIWPFSAPLGYANNGGGQLKTIDPIKGPLVREAFDLYASGEYTMKSIRLQLFERGLRTTKNKPLSKNTFTAVFNNPFYYGVLPLRSSGEAFLGNHEPLVSKTVFDQVQNVLKGRVWRKGKSRHVFAYRRRIRCAACKWRLIGERQKGHVYYRCHGKSCSGTSFREERVGDAIETALLHLRKFVETYSELEQALKDAIEARRGNAAGALRGLVLQRDKIDQRLSAATDAVIDGLIDREAFVVKKSGLLDERARVSHAIARVESGEVPMPPLAAHYLELVKVFRDQAFLGSAEQAAVLCGFTTSNLVARGKTVELQWLGDFQHVAENAKLMSCAHSRDRARTIEYFTKVLMGEENVPTSPCPAKRGAGSRGRAVL